MGHRTRAFGTVLPDWIENPTRYCHAELPDGLKPPLFKDITIRCGRTEHKGAKHSANLRAPGVGSVMWSWR